MDKGGGIEIANMFREASRSDLDGTTFQAKVRDIIWPDGAPANHGWRAIFNRLSDLVGHVEPDTCTYEPDETLNYFDDQDREHETNYPDYGCGSFSCSKCGNEMIFGDGGWFDLEPPYSPNFKHCTECGRPVIPIEYYDRLVDCAEGDNA